jgi:hypothetical protein
VARLFSYVIAYDSGTAPNPYGRYCTLSLCKIGSTRRRNLVELPEPGDWIAGTGAAGRCSAGHGKLVYAMRVDEKMSLEDYFRGPRFEGRADHLAEFSHVHERYVLISRRFFYFGARAVDVDAIPTKHLANPFEKNGRGFRSDFSAAFIADFEDWLGRTYRMGVHGDPCCGRPQHAPGCARRELRLREEPKIGGQARRGVRAIAPGRRSC